METKLSSKGQVIIPKPIRTLHHWEAGQKLLIIDTGDGILLRPQSPFEETALDKVAASLPYTGKTKSLEDMEEGVRKGAMESSS